MSTTFTNTGNFTGNLTGTGTNSANTNTGMATGTGTGSWADSTHSVIWMSRSGKSPAMPNTNQPHAAQYASLTVAALLTIAAASNLIDVYGSALSWTSAAIPATIIGSLVALAGLVPALRLWWQMLFMACAQLVVGPVMTGVSNALATGVNALYNAVPVVCGGVLGAFWQLFVMMGVHAAMIPIILNNLTTLGYCPVNAILGLTVWALAGVALGYALKVKDGETRATAFGTMASALCGITEPVIYTVALTNFKRFICAFVGGGVAGVIGGILGIKFYTWGGDGIFRIPSMINPAGLDISFWGFLICAAIAFVVSAIGSYAVTSADEKA